MKLIAHKINTIDELNAVPKDYGVEIDLRMGVEGKIILSHDPISDIETTLYEYLDKFDHAFIIANIKESGIEEEVINIISKKTENFFLLDIEIPFVTKNYSKYKKFLSVRYSEFESIQTVLNFTEMVDWVWIDTFNILPHLGSELNSFKTCLVSPDRWGRANDIAPYLESINNCEVDVTAVMSDILFLNKWVK
jgi:hypothetical protein